ncbi:ATP-binding cassette domain-containing protein [Herbaspirillum sp. WKF16]|uniref:ABC transporter ATP-binding protein n=1 Tax=Herbaspirillum sp. WKF16 TaxID=3028312 RepID=UPI0023A9EAE6|nr:ATP-binding cassette domain-containing protein [Herbaspirillum sp. WKF16]WDZ95807.1 ATP-binding cassette domain-containing protein [Herbaspirillum sp. WKF16]
MTISASNDGILVPCPRLQAIDVCSAVVAPTCFSVAAGQCAVVAGRSGAGKTRLLRLLADLDPGAGEVFLDGKARSAHSAPEWRKKVLYQSADAAWWRPSVIEHLAMEERDAAQVLAEHLHLGKDRLTAAVSELSTGERQRAALIRSLLKRPAVLLLDEPCSALDAENVLRVEALLLSYIRGGMSVLLVTHSKEQAERLADATIEVKRR